MSDRECSISGCGGKHYARGFCHAHYQRNRSYGDPLAGKATPQRQRGTCAVEGCERPARSRGWCLAHYNRWKRHGDPEAGRDYVRGELVTICQVPDCDAAPAARGWCHTHYMRWKKYGDPSAPLRRAPNGEGWRGHSAGGYIMIKHGRKSELEHRLVMEQILGRRLLPTETVHHKNTIKDDNAPSNLELWDTSQPKGGRVEDKIEWALELLARYGEVDFRRLR